MGDQTTFHRAVSIGALPLTIFLLLFTPAISCFALDQYLIQGSYSRDRSFFEGQLTIKSTLADSNELYIHLPPAWYEKSDWRNNYTYQDSDGIIHEFKRADLDELRGYTRKNPHLPKKMKIKSLSINQQQAVFIKTDNPALAPGRNNINSLLHVDLKPLKLAVGTKVDIIIHFGTTVRAVASNQNLILWDYSPRLVNKIEKVWDFGDFYSSPKAFEYQITFTDKPYPDSEEIFEFRHIGNKSVSFSRQRSVEFDDFTLTPDEHLSDDVAIHGKIVRRVIDFLISDQWLKKGNDKLHVLIWDGSLGVSGNVILLPKKLFRYHWIYHKTFESLLIKAFILSNLQQRYYLNSTEYPWLIPAIYAEVIRSYFFNEYKNDTRFFPWPNWLNPDFFLENSSKHWISRKDDRHLVSAEAPIYLRKRTGIYHPYYEKGFHFLRMTKINVADFGKEMYPDLKNLINPAPDNPEILDDDYLYQQLKFNSENIEWAELWLSVTGSVDYHLRSVEIKELNGRYTVDLQIDNHGNISPAYEVGFFFKEGEITKTILTGAGSYQFLFSESPEEIQIDPRLYLLEDKLLNNSWRLPYQIRPIWDFPSPEKWILTFSPVIGGNTFNSNLIGLSINLSHLSNTEITIDAWRSDSSEKVLWESSITKLGVPWTGSEMYLKISELNASYAKSFGFYQYFKAIHPELGFGIVVSDEKLDELEEETLDPEENVWHQISSRFLFPVYNGSFLTCNFDTSAGYGINIKDDSFEFHRQSIKQITKLDLGNYKFHANLSGRYSYGTTPLQKKFPMGGPEALPGFPRTTDLLFDQRRIFEFGSRLPPVLTHSNLNLMQLAWIERVDTSLIFHWGEGVRYAQNSTERFRDVELRFSIFAEWLNMYLGEGVFSIAQPLGHEEYKDYRIILFSNWVF